MSTRITDTLSESGDNKFKFGNDIIILYYAVQSYIIDTKYGYEANLRQYIYQLNEMEWGKTNRNKIK